MAVGANVSTPEQSRIHCRFPLVARDNVVLVSRSIREVIAGKRYKGNTSMDFFLASMTKCAKHRKIDVLRAVKLLQIFE